MRRFCWTVFFLCGLHPLLDAAEAYFEGDERDLFKDLALVDVIDKELHDELPFFYNFSMMGGYFNMPSARMNRSGTVAVGGGRVPPYNLYGVNFQVFDRIELSGNYRVYKGQLDPTFGHEGFGDEAERIGNIKIALNLPSDGFPGVPLIAFGADDFIGTQRFNSQYVVFTQTWERYNLELSLGWGRKRLKGLFGGVAWTPLRKTPLPFFKDIALVVEYDAIDYKHHAFEHAKGRSVHTRWNVGLSYLGWEALQLSVSSIRGEKIAGFASLRYPLGSSEGFFPKVDNPHLYTSPVDTEPMGAERPEKEFAQELAYALSDQGLDLYTVYLLYDAHRNKELWVKVVNNRYRLETDVRERIQRVLAAIVPSDVATVIVVIEAEAVPCQTYRFRTQDLYRYRMGIVDAFEMETLAPMRDAALPPWEYDSTLLFQRTKDIWTFTILPRFQAFFGSAQGKFKYNLGLVATPEGYLFDEVYYRLQFSYSVVSSFSSLKAIDRLNPSQLPMVRTDSILYFQPNTVSLEEAYLQKSWNLGRGFYYRLAAGYFEPAYGGGATEFLWYPVNSDFAIGARGAVVLKRRYHGISFSRKIRRLHGFRVTHEKFVGIQYFLDLYYTFRPLDMDVRFTLGQFLAKDKGVRTEVGRTFKSGVRFALWYTVTNGHDKVNGHTYYDKGFIFSIPLDLFLRQSSRTYVGYSMAAWLRDVGAQAETGKQLYDTLFEERYRVSDYGF
jgi:hypothetical protein